MGYTMPILRPVSINPYRPRSLFRVVRGRRVTRLPPCAGRYLKAPVVFLAKFGVLFYTPDRHYRRMSDFALDSLVIVAI